MDYCCNCGDVVELVTDVRMLNTLSNLLSGRWTLWVCPTCGKVEFFGVKGVCARD